MRKRFICLQGVFFCFFLLGFEQTAFAQKRKQMEIIPNQKETDVDNQRVFLDAMKAYFVEDYKAAITLFEKMDSSLATSSSVPFMMAKCYAALDNNQKAIYYFEQTTRKNPENTYAYMELANAYEKQSNLMDAQKTLEKLRALSPQNPIYLERLVTVATRQGKWENALTFLELLEKNAGLTEEFLLKKQQILLQLNKVEEVFKESDTQNVATPTTIFAEVKKIQLLFEQKKWIEAEKVLTNLLTKNPKTSEYLGLLATAQFKQNKWQESIEVCVNSLANENIDYVPFEGILLDLIKENKMTTASTQLLFESLKKRVTSNQEPSSFSKLLATLADFLENWEETEKWAKVCVEADENSFEIWEYLLTANLRLNHADELIKNAEEATSLFPSQPLFWLRLAEGFSLKEDWKKVQESAEMALDIPSNQVKVQAKAALLLGDSFLQLNQKSKALATWKDALSFGIDTDLLQSRIEKNKN